MSVRIYAVSAGSPAEKADIRPDEYILSINGEEIIDEIDYQALSAESVLHMQIRNASGVREIKIKKEEWEPLGLRLDETESMKPRHCRNKCVFCFVDQLPSGMRGSLYVKDDDWRAWRQAHTKATICSRDSKGNPYGCKDNDYQIKDFTAAKVDAEDGGVIDFSNKARLGTTLKGAGIGGALGGFAGYQGAQADIEERLNQALREYSASLEKIYCGTGKKFLGFYNDDVIIPTMKD